MSVNINISNKAVYTLITLAIVLVIAIGINAYNSGGPPSTMGHSIEEIEGVQAKITNGLTACSGANLAIKTINPDTGAVTCETDDVGSGGIILNSNVYTRTASGDTPLGTHAFCFLTQIRNLDGSSSGINGGCEVRESSGSWTLYAYGTEPTCTARCVD
ncbi:MAG: hypothetical protein KKB31_04720 [Nanoarchaeota archaeon]|nr:hypothetical protein [Nanoarchaeota archaeon]